VTASVYQDEDDAVRLALRAAHAGLDKSGAGVSASAPRGAPEAHT
jgi:hypothetical protein